VTATAGSDPVTVAAGRAQLDPVTVECIRTLYRQMPNSFAAAIVVTVYMLFTGWPYTAHGTIFAWLGVQALSQVLRLGLFLAYRSAQPGPERLRLWAYFYTAYMFIAGLIWGSTLFLFWQQAQPITLALTMCGVYGISAGSVPGNAYNLPGCLSFIGTIFAMTFVRMLLIGDFGHIVLGVASLLFAAIMLGFARVQNRVLREGFAIRFENVQLLGEMREAREHAETAWRQAEAANLAKSQFLAAASHDLRQPLYALSLFSGALKDFALTDDAHSLVRNIQDNIAAMETLFNGLLDLSRLEAGAVKTSEHPFALQDLFDRLCHYFEPIAEAQGLSLACVPTTAWVKSDEVLCEQVMMNLIANALRYTTTGGVVIGARHSHDGGQDKVGLQVFDTGKGIDAADQARIFDEFVQVGNTERDRTKGLGLGLAIASRTVRLLGSHIDLKSALGKGSRFSFDLRRTSPGAAQPAPARGPAADLAKGLRVLIIDDDQAVREALNLLLSGWGLNYTVAADLAEARRAMAKGAAYQVVLCDYRLREGHVGLDFLTGLKDAAGDGPRPGLGLITGDVESDVMRRAQAADIFLIHKPVDPARLRALLNHLGSQAQTVEV